jgi:uncharacterized membrane protein HdeD (DUF308 family)
MPSMTVMFGVVLTALGVVAFFNPEQLGVGKDGKPAEPGHPTSLTPVVIGAVLVLGGVVSLAAPRTRKNAMKATAVAAILGTVGGLVPVFLRGGNIAEVAVKVGLGMSLLCVFFLAMSVRAFVWTRRAREVRERSSSAPR